MNRPLIVLPYFRGVQTSLVKSHLVNFAVEPERRRGRNPLFWLQLLPRRRRTALPSSTWNVRLRRHLALTPLVSLSGSYRVPRTCRNWVLSTIDILEGGTDEEGTKHCLVCKRTTNPIYQSLGPLVMMRRPGGDHDQSETTGQSSGSQGRAGAALA